MKIEIAGRGNVATHLRRALAQAGHDVRTVNPHAPEDARRDCDILLLCVTDNAIAEVARAFAAVTSPETVMAHTSGSTPLSAIAGMKAHTGVFYPMQTFSKEVELEYSTIPFFIEGSDNATAHLLLDTALGISANSRLCSSEQRRVLHVASVLCCNMTNHLWALADAYLRDNGLDFNSMLPLIRETVRKAGGARPADVQTGPASRGDTVTIASHLEALSDHPEMKGIYQILTESIKRHSHERNKL